MDIYYLVSNLLMSPSLWMASALFIVGYIWVAKVDNVDRVIAAHVNLLQSEKIDRDGEIPFTGTSQWDKGADIASASTLAPGNDGNYFDVTGTTGITAINAVRSQPGTVIKLHFDGIVLITHHATNLVMPDGENYTTAAGDELEFIECVANQWRCTNISPDPNIGSHADTHELGGSDAIKLDDLAIPDDNVNLDASITRHGLLKRLDNDPSHYLDGQGAWTVPPGSGKYAVTAKSDNYSVLLGDCLSGKALSMNAVVEKTFSLPSVVNGDIGAVITFAKIGTGKLIIAAADADIIGESSNGGTVENSTFETFATVTLLLIGANGNAQWLVVGYHGSWVFT